jgi:rSAM/selenodomain-associated transferase 1
MEDYRHPGALLAIMAKAPVPGAAKTRLIPALGAEGAARLHARLLRDTLARLAAARLCPVQLWCAPDTRHPAFAEWAAQVELCPQPPGSLGERMDHIARAGLSAARPVVIVGTDLPELDAAYVEAALLALAEASDAVLGPTEDGGYGLLGLNRFDPSVFEGLPWSTAGVADETRRRFRALGWNWRELPRLWDVDRPEDWARFETLSRNDPKI